VTCQLIIGKKKVPPKEGAGKFADEGYGRRGGLARLLIRTGILAEKKRRQRSRVNIVTNLKAKEKCGTIK